MHRRVCVSLARPRACAVRCPSPESILGRAPNSSCRSFVGGCVGGPLPKIVQWSILPGPAPSFAHRPRPGGCRLARKAFSGRFSPVRHRVSPTAPRRVACGEPSGGCRRQCVGPRGCLAGSRWGCRWHAHRAGRPVTTASERRACGGRAFGADQRAEAPVGRAAKLHQKGRTCGAKVDRDAEGHGPAEESADERSGEVPM